MIPIKGRRTFGTYKLLVNKTCSVSCEVITTSILATHSEISLSQLIYRILILKSSHNYHRIAFLNLDPEPTQPRAPRSTRVSSALRYFKWTRPRLNLDSHLNFILALILTLHLNQIKMF